jgi:putative endonuclease
METKDLGDFGERIARKYLQDKGYKILDKNFRYSKLGELDIIASLSNNIVFFDVKSREKKGISGFFPEDNITPAKQKKLVKLARIYLAKHRLSENPWQIDILAVEVYRNKSFDVRHTENAVGDMY